MILVEEGAHLRQAVGRNAQVAKAHLLTEARLDVGGAEIEALRSDQQRQRREEHVVVAQDQRLGTDAAIDISIRIEVTDRRSAAAQHLDRHLDRSTRQHLATGFAHLRQAVAHDVFRQGFVGTPFRITKRKQHRQHDAPRTLHALGQHAIGIQLRLGLFQHCPHLLQLGWRRLDAGNKQFPVQFAEPGHIGITGIDLRLEEQRRVGDDLGLGARQQVGHLCVQVARPRPAAEIGDGGIVDRNDGDAGQRLAGRGAHTPVVGLALEALHEVAAGEHEHDRRNDQPEKPVRLPEPGLAHPASAGRLFADLLLSLLCAATPDEAWRNGKNRKKKQPTARYSYSGASKESMSAPCADARANARARQRGCCRIIRW